MYVCIYVEHRDKNQLATPGKKPIFTYALELYVYCIISYNISIFDTVLSF